MARILRPWHLVLGLPILAYSQVTAPNVVPTSTINSQADATSLASTSPTFTGSILISSAASDTIDLHGLTSVTGNLICENAASLTTFQSDTLTSIGGEFQLQTLTSFTNLSVPNLQSVGGAVIIQNNPDLMTVSLPQLHTVAWHFELLNDTALTNFSLPSLQTVGGGFFVNGPVTNFILAPGVSVTDDFTLEFNSTFDCNSFVQGSASPSVKGDYICTSNTTHYDHPSPYDDSNTVTNHARTAGIIAGVAVGAFVLFVGGGFLLFKLRRRRAVRKGLMHKDHDIMLAERRGVPELVNGSV